MEMRLFTSWKNFLYFNPKFFTFKSALSNVSQIFLLRMSSPVPLKPSCDRMCTRSPFPHPRSTKEGFSSVPLSAMSSSQRRER